MCDKAADLGVIHAERELGLQPATFAREKRSLFGQIDKIITDYSNTRAFFITGVAKEEILKQARAYTLEWMKANLEAYPDEKFVSGLLDILRDWLPVRDASGRMVNTAARTETIARTNVLDLYNYGRWAIFTSPAMAGWVEAFQFSAILDTRTTLLCRGLHGRIFTKEESKNWLPPLHFNALESGTHILTRNGERHIEDITTSDEVMTHRGRWRKVYATMNKKYEKSVVLQLHLSSDRALFITHEHPILTTGGWKVAGDLKCGDVLFQYGQNVEGGFDGVMPNPDHYPPLFDEPFVPWDVVQFLGSRIVSLPINLKDNVAFNEGKVGDIPAKSELMFERDTAPGEDCGHLCFSVSEVDGSIGNLGSRRLFGNAIHSHGVAIGHSLGMSSHNGVGLLPEAPCPMGFSALPIGIVLPVGDANLLYAGANGNSVALAPPAKCGFTDPDIPFDGTDGFSITPMSILDEGITDAEFSQVIPHNLPPVACGAQIGWVPTTIMTIAEVDVKGNVWNLAVEEDETYIAGGVIVHNCRSILLPVTRLDVGWKDAYNAQKPLREDQVSQEGF